MEVTFAMNLRPHHILCIQKFTGYGYNAEFTAHMLSIVSKLKEEPESQIIITQGCDDLCEMCPHNINNVCTSLEKVSIMDSAVLDICYLAYGKSVSWAELAGRGRERVFGTDEFNHICACCQWFELCQNTKI